VNGSGKCICGKCVCVDEMNIEVAVIVCGVNILLCGESMKYVCRILLYGSVRACVRAYVTPPPFGLKFGVGTENRFRIENLKNRDEIRKNLKIGPDRDRISKRSATTYKTEYSCNIRYQVSRMGPVLNEYH
jgi:hypothetical protein